jgi:zinc protease
MLQISGKCLRKDLPLLLNLMAEQLRMPAFSPAEFAKLQKQIAGSIRQQLDRRWTRSPTTNCSRWPVPAPR